MTSRNNEHKNRHDPLQLNPTINGPKARHDGIQGGRGNEKNDLHSGTVHQSSINFQFTAHDEDFVNITIIEENPVAVGGASLTPTFLSLGPVPSEMFRMTRADKRFTRVPSWSSYEFTKTSRSPSMDSLAVEISGSGQSTMASSFVHVIGQDLHAHVLSHTGGAHLNFLPPVCSMLHPLILTPSLSPSSPRRSHSRLVHCLNNFDETLRLGQSTPELSSREKDQEDEAMLMSMGRRNSTPH